MRPDRSRPLDRLICRCVRLRVTSAGILAPDFVQSESWVNVVLRALLVIEMLDFSFFLFLWRIEGCVSFVPLLLAVLFRCEKRV